jgi:hypothetical protein
MILEFSSYTTEDEPPIKEDFSNLIDNALNELFTAEFIFESAIYLPMHAIQRFKRIINEEVYSCLFAVSLFGPNSTGKTYDLDQVFYIGNWEEVLNYLSLQEIFRHPFLQGTVRRSTYDEEEAAANVEAHVRENTSILFAGLQKSKDENLSILNELSESMNTCLRNLFTLEFVKRIKPKIGPFNFEDLKKIVDTKAFAEILKSSFKPPLII